jgi:hypothetical protein
MILFGSSSDIIDFYKRSGGRWLQQPFALLV